MQINPTLRTSVGKAIVGCLSSALFLMGGVGCEDQIPAEAGISQTSEVAEATPNTKTNAKRRVDTGAEIANEPLQASAGQTVFEFAVQGMTCAGCANSINTETAALAGVTKVRISLVQNKAWVAVSADSLAAKSATADEIAAAIQNAGDYTASLVNQGIDEQAAEESVPADPEFDATDDHG